MCWYDPEQLPTRHPSYMQRLMPCWNREHFIGWTLSAASSTDLADFETAQSLTTAQPERTLAMSRYRSLTPYPIAGARAPGSSGDDERGTLAPGCTSS